MVSSVSSGTVTIFIQYEQGEEGSFFFAEEAVWPEYSPKQINVTDRATILNFIIGLNGYTVCTGIDNGDLNNEKIVTVPLDTDDEVKNRRTVGHVDLIGGVFRQDRLFGEEEAALLALLVLDERERKCIKL